MRWAIYKNPVTWHSEHEESRSPKALRVFEAPRCSCDDEVDR